MLLYFCVSYFAALSVSGICLIAVMIRINVWGGGGEKKYHLELKEIRFSIVIFNETMTWTNQAPNPGLLPGMPEL